MYIAILGRQPALGTAELEQVFGASSVDLFSGISATIQTDTLEIQRLGGTQKAGHVVAETSGDWRKASQAIISQYSSKWSNHEGKITLGISAYGFDVSAREVQKTGIVLKQRLKQSSTSLRLIPNSEPALNTATSHHNKLGLSDNKIELLVVRGKKGRVIIAESTGAQNITAYTKRDQERPKRDAFVGMLPPKLAQMMINLAHLPGSGRILDPFCGTGVILQEAAFLGYSVYGTDLSDKMIEFSKVNLEWLARTHHTPVDSTLTQGDAMTTLWQQPIDAVVGEAYLGQPFSAPPSNSKLAEVRRNCDHIISSFLRNLSPQIKPGTPLCVAIPAWKDINGTFTHLPLIHKLSELGYAPVVFKNVSPSDLLYYREDQVVARELLVLRKA
jgi:tRNA (guanine10-N2)-dimethyltransferase